MSSSSVFTRPHEYDKSPYSKVSNLESVFENLRLRCWCCTVAVFGEKNLRFRKYPATCGRGLRCQRELLETIDLITKYNNFTRECKTLVTFSSSTILRPCLEGERVTFAQGLSGSLIRKPGQKTFALVQTTDTPLRWPNLRPV